MSKYKNWDMVMNYAQDVVSGKIPANQYRIKGCERFLSDLKNPAYDFQPRDAEFCIGIIEKTLCHQQGERQDGMPLRGTPFYLLPFHKFIIYNLLGFKMAGTKINRFHEALIFIPRKNIKTSFAASLAYALGLLYRMSGSKIYVVAAALKQTLETFDFLKYNIENMGEDQASGGPFRIIDNNNEHSISAELGGGLFDLTALAANPDAQDSFNCNVAIADEIHAFKKPKQYNLFKEAMKAYTNKLMIGISTAGDDPNSFLAQRVRYCKRVLDGEISDEQYFIFICEADPMPGENGKKFIDYTNPKTHEMANPAYGASIRPEEMQNDAFQAQNDPQQRKDFFAKSLNVFTSAMETYFDMAEVEASDNKYHWTLEELAKLPITWYGGADLSKLYDLTGTSLHGRYQDVDICITHGFIPVVQAHLKAEEDNIPFFWWEEMGWLTLCNHEVIEYEDVVKWFLSMKQMGFKIKWVGYDKRYAREFVLKMKKAGFKMRDQSQRYVEKTEAFREIEKQIKRGRFSYLGNMAYAYCIGNVKAIEDSDDFVRFEKIQPNQRIDLFDADVIATKQMLIDMEKSQKASDWLQ
ncbi:terminase large subunit [Anaerotignum lactatifermentans]|uniref:terminase large subunit n=1 Tax=Anaerotignum lactatifermentans TaxID=160404 RepID=UPI00255CBA5E|nr:terminase large subunit [Anaerotignum lactatifermentans]